MLASHAWGRLPALAGLAAFLAACAPIAPLPAAEPLPQVEDQRRPKRLIATGWDNPDAARLRENLAEMERRPFDGVVVQLVGRDEAGEAVPLYWAFHERPWQREWFREEVARLAECEFRTITDNFLLLLANPGHVDWFDDEGWRAIVDHCRIAAWAARAGGMQGIAFDPEPYAPPAAQFHYAAQPQYAEHSFDGYYAKARQRGAEMMAAIVEEYPDITLLCYFMNSVVAAAADQPDPRRALEPMGYGLLPAFIDGWLDAAPPTVTFVDGCETAYRFNSPEQFLRAAVDIKGICQNLVSPENRARYRAQVEVGFGIYLDAYWNPPDSPWYIDGLGGPRVDRLRANTAAALAAADTYVWIYGEQFRWWPTPNPRVGEKTWPAALPGSEAALRFVRDPVAFARDTLARRKTEGTLVNLARNGSFDEETATSVDGQPIPWRESNPPAGWSAWQREGSDGRFAWDRTRGANQAGSGHAVGVADGCLLQAYHVRPGERYAVRTQVRLAGASRAWIRVRWQTADERWTAEEADRIFYPHGTGTWCEAFGVVEIPEGVGRMLVLLGVGGPGTEDDQAWFDDVGVYRLP